MHNGKPLFFAAVQIKKNYGSYHLMAVYVFPDLLDEISPPRRARMQGKSRFNFKVIDNALFAQLGRSTKAAYQRYRRAGYV